MDEELADKQDQELIELLNEIRVGLSGAAVLFGFLLIVPFSATWDETTRPMRGAYVISFVTTLLSVVALMAPTAYHRLRWRERNKERMLRAANLSTLAGMTFLAVAMTAAVYLVIDSVVNATWALVLTGFSAAAFAGMWLALPLSAPYDRWDDDGQGDEAHGRRGESAAGPSSEHD